MLHSSPYYFTTIKIWTKISVAIRLQGLKISSGLTTIHCYRIKQHTYADLEYVLSNNINLNEHKYQNQTIWILVSGDLWTWGGGGVHNSAGMSPLETRLLSWATGSYWRQTQLRSVSIQNPDGRVNEHHGPGRGVWQWGLHTAVS